MIMIKKMIAIIMNKTNKIPNNDNNNDNNENNIKNMKLSISFYFT